MIKASSIYESVISIAIISITITVATYVFVNIMNSQKSLSFYQMTEEVAKLKYDCIAKQNFTNNTITFKAFKIEKTVQNFKENNQLKLVRFKVKSNNKVVKTFHYLIRKNIN